MSFSGTGDTIPFVCLETDVEKAMFAMDFSTVPRARDKVSLGRSWARGKITADQCARRQNQTGQLIGTTFVARDLLSVAEAFGEDGQLRYWGELQPVRDVYVANGCVRLLIWDDSRGDPRFHVPGQSGQSHLGWRSESTRILPIIRVCFAPLLLSTT